MAGLSSHGLANARARVTGTKTDYFDAAEVYERSQSSWNLCSLKLSAAFVYALDRLFGRFPHGYDAVPRELL